MSLLQAAEIPELVPAGTAVRTTAEPAPWRRLLARFGVGAARAAVIAIGAFWLLPTFGLFVAGLRDTADNSATGWWTVFTAPSQLTLDNYAALLGNARIMSSLGNTMLITVPSTLLVLGLGALAAYALAWVRFPGRDVVFALVVALTVVPAQIAIIPDAALFQAAHIFGEIPAVVAFHVAFGLPFAIFLLRGYFLAVPPDLVEAARADGAGELRIFARLVVPLCWPGLGSLAIFQFLWVWNDLLVALVFGFQNPPITYAIREQMRAFSSNIDVVAPGSFVSMAIPLILFFAFQRQVTRMMVAGAFN